VADWALLIPAERAAAILTDAELEELSCQIDNKSQLDYYPLLKPAIAPNNDPTLPPRLEPRPAPVELWFAREQPVGTGLSVATKLGATPDSRLYRGGAVNSSWAAIRASSAGPGSQFIQQLPGTWRCAEQGVGELGSNGRLF